MEWKSCLKQEVNTHTHTLTSPISSGASQPPVAVCHVPTTTHHPEESPVLTGHA